MATLVLSAAGMAVGGSIGGAVAGVSAATIGRAVGATFGRAIDQRLLGSGSQAVETGRVDRFRITGASEGSAIGSLYGRMRVGGQVIWTTEFLECAVTSGGGKGTRSQPTTTTYSYSVSLAIALCEGVIGGIGRVWADGAEVDPETLNMRVYTGAADQMPDPKIAAVEGDEAAPAFRGTAYAVFEDLKLEQFGNRVPQFTFEVLRPTQAPNLDAPQDLTDAVQAVALLPGSGEYVLATTPVYFDKGFGQTVAANVNNISGTPDLLASLDSLTEELPAVASTSLIVSWFGNDLRCGSCEIEPLVEQKEADGAGMPWRVSGQDRAAAGLVPDDEGRPLYGGTPADASVVEAIAALKARNQAVMFYPFILMTQVAGNGLENPYDPDDEDQPSLPWRGRITTSRAPGVVGSPDQTSAAETEVAAFFGSAAPSDFSVSGSEVIYSGPVEWSYRRFILHNAHLCVAAGGVDAFCIGSEMRGLTQIRGAGDAFVAVTQLKQLAAEVKAILGADTKISYAADWTEYFGYHPTDGSDDLFYHLDPLWSDPNIDFIGIDNYMPLSDWRDGDDHLDADAGSIYNLDYLAGNVAGGEGYEYYYHSGEARDAQIRTEITDGAYDAPWEFRFKDLKSWWSNLHYERRGGVRLADETAWEPQQKPFWFTELGCAAIDKGTNQPNKFLDPKSSESQVPYGSNGQRDDLIQLQYLRAHALHWADPTNNPVSEIYEAPMVDVRRSHVWAWDARPYPAFPQNVDVWSDSENYLRGHWLTGRTGGRTLASVVTEICERSGVTCFDTSRLYGYVRGYQVADVESARAALQPLMLVYGFDVVERDGVLQFFNRKGAPVANVDHGVLAIVDDRTPAIEQLRIAEAETAGRHQLIFVDAEGSYEAAAEESIFPDERSETVAQTEVPLVLTRAEAKRTTERWLAEARLARDSAQFALPPSLSHLGAGDVVSVTTADDVVTDYRIDRVEVSELQQMEAVRIDRSVYDQTEVYTDTITPVNFVPPTPMFPVFLDLPLLRGDEVEHAPHLAVTAVNWPGSASVYASPTATAYELNDVVTLAATLGATQTILPAADPARFDRANTIRVQLTRGTLSSVTSDALLAGANLAAIGDGSSDNWELIQFQNAALVGENTYDLSLLLRGQRGSDALMPLEWADGATFVLLDGSVGQLTLPAALRGISQTFLIGPSGRAFDDPIYVERTEAFAGIGLRPYAPVHLRATEGAGVTTLSWTRRTRIDGDLWSGLDVPLGEDTESYLLRIYNGAVLVREETVSAASWEYSDAAKASDGITGPYTFDVAQISAKFGYGLFRAQHVSG